MYKLIDKGMLIAQSTNPIYYNTTQGGWQVDNTIYIDSAKEMYVVFEELPQPATDGGPSVIG